ncbi:MAG TPA: response regulator [Blastocatellia bacterium]|nr:response regulator [Blastocatellia bacterium]
MTRVLLVDDDRQLREMLKVVLERAGYQVEDFPNGSDAMDSHSVHPADLILTDLVMPDKEGLETIREVRRADRNVKIIAMSGGGRTGTLDYLGPAKVFGADATIAKPFTRDEILTMIRGLLESSPA